MSTDEAREKSHAVWERMAPGWERKGDYIWQNTNHVGRAMVEALELSAGDTVLDLACGPGDTGFLALESVGSSGRLIATDFSQNMVDVARRRAGDLGLENVDFNVMNAEDMDLPDDSVDAILCRWGFMLMVDPAAALRECRRVLRDSGRLSFSVWGGADKNPWVTNMGMVMTQQGHPPQGDPWGPGGMFSMAEPAKVEDMVKEAGFTTVRTAEVPVEWRFSDFNEIWTFTTELAGALAAVLQNLDDDEVARIRDAYEEVAQVYKTDDGFVFPGVTVNAVAG